MVDFMSRYRLYGFGYSIPSPRRTMASTNRDLYRLTEPHLFSTPRVKVHDCREQAMKELTDQFTWETFLLSKGVRQANDSVTSLHSKARDETKDGIKKPEKLLFDVGRRGTAAGDLNWPRGMTVNPHTAEIIIADTMNHRIQIFNQFGVYKTKIGHKGLSNGCFNEPTGVGVCPDGRIVIADKKNRRIQVLGEDGRFKYSFPTIDQPFSVTVDTDFNVAIATVARSIELYRRGGKLLKRFELGGSGRSPVYIAFNDKREVVISDTKDHVIKFYNYEGELLYKFTPESTGESLACHPAGVWIHNGDIVIADNLNHTINLYSERGRVISQLAGPTDDVGAAQTVAVGPEGHLIMTEFTTNGRHCIKILRYLDCDCHKTRPGSSKRRSRPGSRNAASSLSFAGK
ncbi:unnamed protein product [Owenia fusiformis]|uniref:Uncharacterized protein n=1 Tax=Owenia fusiformis TaxID=6347 RepID=A0A8J1XGX5_OWEFU|nr:unnamed protein product [Owenia fusiformis]